jgi:hypothetical protein
MQTPDANRFRDLLRAMGRVFGNEPDGVVLDAYWLALKDWDLEAFEQACGHLLKTSKFMPRPADFTELRKAGRKTAGEAWAEVLHYVRNGYSYVGERLNGSAEPEDAAMLAAVRAIGGYNAIAMSRTDQTPHLERRFCEHYDAISQAEDVRESVPLLAAPVTNLLKQLSQEKSL